MARKSTNPQDKVLLDLRGSTGELISRIELTYENYYEESTPAIDSNDFRRTHGIRFIEGEIYNRSRELQQRFQNQYNERGEYVHGRSVHADGTIIED